MAETVDPKQKCALVLINQKSRQGAELISRVQVELQNLGLRVVIPEDARPEEFSALVRHHAKEIDLVVVGAGDGGIRCALQGVIDTSLPLGVLPLGTANNLARNLGIPNDLQAACRVLAGDHCRTIDVAEVNGFPFLNVAGMGLSARVNRTTPGRAKKILGTLAFAATALRHYKRLKPFRAQIRCDGGEVRLRGHKVMQLHICNGRFFGAGMVIDPSASIDDGTLDLALTESVGFLQSMKIMGEFLLGRGDDHVGLLRLRAKEIRIETKHRMPIDVDGDLLTHTPAVFRVIPAALRVLAPQEPLVV